MNPISCVRNRAAPWTLLALSVVLTPACRQTDDAGPALPFSAARQVGDTLYLSGQAASDASGPGAATQKVMAGLKAELVANGFTLDDVVASQVWLADLQNYKQMNDVYGAHFSKHFPSRTTVGAERLPGNADVEIAMVASKAEKKFVAGNHNLPFSTGVIAGDTVYLSGQVGIDPSTGKLVNGDIVAHTTQTMKNIENHLKSMSMSFADAVSVWVYLTDPDTFDDFSTTYKQFITGAAPVRIPVGVNALPLNSPIEITIIASRGHREPVWQLDAKPSPTAIYSPGLKADNRVYLAGTGSKKSTMEECVDQCMQHLDKVLQGDGLTFDDVVEARVYLSNLDDYAAMNTAYRKYFENTFPTRATIGVKRLVRDFRIYVGLVAAAR